MLEPAGAPLNEIRDHGGSLSQARRLFPHAPDPGLDLSTGINPHSYPLGEIPASAFTRRTASCRALSSATSPGGR